MALIVQDEQMPCPPRNALALVWRSPLPSGFRLGGRVVTKAFVLQELIICIY